MASEPVDDEMLEMFRAESTEHLNELEQALLRLEDEPGDSEAIDSARRQAHNLKGAARILGFQEVEDLAHGIEDILSRFDGEARLEREEVDALFEAMDALERLVDAATGGPPAQPIGLQEVFEDLEAAQEAQPTDAEPQPRPEEPSPRSEREEPADREAPADERPDPLERARAHRIDTIRVDPARLDVLLRRASEMSAAVQTLDAVTEDLERGRESADEISRLVRSELPADTDPAVLQRLRRGTEHLAETLASAVDQVDSETTHLARLADAIEGGIQETRLLPMSMTFDRFARAVRDLARGEDKQVDLEIEGETVRADKRVVEELQGPLMHLIRNAVDHGIESPEERRAAGKDPEGRIRLAAQRTPDSIRVEVEDDGRGIDPDEIRRVAREQDLLPEAELAELGDGEVVDLVFDAGFTTREEVSDVSGRGIGLETVAESVERLQGTVTLDSTAGEGTRVSLEVPVELSTAPVLLVSAGPHTYGVPVEAVQGVLTVGEDDVENPGEAAVLDVEGTLVPVADIHRALELGQAPRDPFEEGARPCLLLGGPEQRQGLLVDSLIGETEVVVEPLGRVLREARSVTGASVLSDGEICVLLDPVELGKAARERGLPVPAEETGEGALRRVLLVEDTELTRRQLQRRLERTGWHVLTAEDGDEALEELKSREVDIVVTDILMPTVDGLELTRRIREDPQLRGIPVVLLSTRDEDKEAHAAMEAGADAFVSKDPFDPRELAETLEELVAWPR